MISRANRLPSSVRISHDRASISQNFMIKVQKIEQTGNRIGVVVSKKTAKTAVKRNLMKRKVREYVQKHIVNLKSGHDVLIIIKKDISEQGLPDVEKELQELFLRTGLL